MNWCPAFPELVIAAVAAAAAALAAAAAVAGWPGVVLGMSRLGPGRGGLSSTRVFEGEPAAVNGPAARFTFEVPRWGKRAVGTVTLSLHDRWRLAEGRVTFTLPPVDCYPSPAVQRTEVVLARLPNRLGEHRARAPGDGTEFNGVREFVPGDRQRAINWPASTRLGRLQVNTFSAERRFADAAAKRIWRMEQEAIRFSLRELGVPVVPWDGKAPLDIPLAPYTRRPLVTRR